MPFSIQSQYFFLRMENYKLYFFIFLKIYFHRHSPPFFKSVAHSIRKKKSMRNASDVLHKPQAGFNFWEPIKKIGAARVSDIEPAFMSPLFPFFFHQAPQWFFWRPTTNSRDPQIQTETSKLPCLLKVVVRIRIDSFLKNGKIL